MIGCRAVKQLSNTIKDISINAQDLTKRKIIDVMFLYRGI